MPCLLRSVGSDACLLTVELISIMGLPVGLTARKSLDNICSDMWMA